MQTQNRVMSVLTLAPCALYRLDEPGGSITVLEGRAWITADGRDVIAGAGQTLSLDGAGMPALISGLLGRAVTLRIEPPARPGRTLPGRGDERPAYAPSNTGC